MQQGAARVLGCVIALPRSFELSSNTNQERTIAITTPASSGGTSCPASPQSESCSLTPCPGDCVFSWNSWCTLIPSLFSSPFESALAPCSASCGTGTRVRTPCFEHPLSSLTDSKPDGNHACHHGQPMPCLTGNAALPRPLALPGRLRVHVERLVYAHFSPPCLVNRPYRST